MANNQFTSPHGHKPKNRPASPTYTSWSGMRSRCSNPKNPNYRDYGAVGITVCARWGDFRAFLLDMGPRPKGTSIDRIDGTKGYSPDNCRWATLKEQARNKSTTVRYTVGCESLTVPELEEVTGIKDGTIRDRLARGWCLEKAITKPSPGRNQKGESHPHAILTDDKVRDIVILRGKGMSEPKIAASLGIHRWNVNHVLSGRLWRHITGITPREK